MAETAHFTIGAEVSCSDGACGEVRRVVVDPVARAVTHLVVGPEHPHGLGLLVPLNLFDATAGGIRLRCTLAEFARLSWAKETLFLKKNGLYSGYATGQVFSWPYYGVGGPLGALHLGNLPQTVTRHSVPLGRGGDQPRRSRPHRRRRHRAGPGPCHRPPQPPRDHVLLQEGHLWGRKEVAIPIGAVTGVGDGIRLSITRQQVRDLPPVDIDHPDGTTGGGEDTDDDPDTDWAPGFAGPLRVKPGSTVRLPDDFDPGERFGLHKKKDGARLLQRGTGLLEEYQRRLAAQDTWGVLVVLQAIDAGGKDGTIRHGRYPGPEAGPISDWPDNRTVARRSGKAGGRSQELIVPEPCWPRCRSPQISPGAGIPGQVWVRKSPAPTGRHRPLPVPDGAW